MAEPGRPVRSNYGRWRHALVVLLTLIAVLYLSGWLYKAAQTISEVLALYFFAWLVQFFFTPVVDAMTRRRIPRLLAVSLVYLALGLAVVAILIVTVPALYNQGQHLASVLSKPSSYQVISRTTRSIEAFIETNFHVPHSQIQRFTQEYSVSLQHGAFTAGSKLTQFINGGLASGGLKSGAAVVLNLLNTLNVFLLDTAIVLILAFYMMLDGHTLVRQALAYFPPAVDEVMERVHLTINRKFGGYLRGQVLIALGYGFLTYLIALGFDLRYPLPIAIFAAILMLIPFIGAFLSVVPPLVAFVLVHVGDTSFPVIRFALLFVFLAVMQHIMINLLAPRVMGSAMDMHPLLVILGLLLGAKLAGFWGAVFGVPVLGVLLDTIDHIYRYVMERRYGFHPGPSAPGPGGQKPPGRTGRGQVRRLVLGWRASRRDRAVARRRFPRSP